MAKNKYKRYGQQCWDGWTWTTSRRPHLLHPPLSSSVSAEGSSDSSEGSSDSSEGSSDSLKGSSDDWFIRKSIYEVLINVKIITLKMLSEQF